MRGLLVVAALAAVTASSAVAAPQRPAIDLTITYWPSGDTTGPFRRWTLRCGPLGGTLPMRRRACRRLARLGARVFAPVPRSAICTEIYGGPQRARVKGRFGTRTIWSTFARTNGCEISRWQRLTPWLLPAVSAASRAG